jgi:hypothetical protein
LLLLAIEECAKTVEARVPEHFVAVEPFVRGAQRARLELHVDDAAGLAPLDEAGVLEDGQCLMKPVSDIPKGSASSPTECSPRSRRASTPRRVGSDSALKTASSRAA